MKCVTEFILSQLIYLCTVFLNSFPMFGYRFPKEMPRKSSGDHYFWDPAKEKKFLLQLDEYLACSVGKHPPKATLELWAAQFNAEFGGVPAHRMTLYQKKERMKKIYRDRKALQSRTGLGYDPSTDRVICSDEAWQSFIGVTALCNIRPYVILFNYAMIILVLI